MNSPPGDGGGGSAHGIFGSSGISGFGYGIGVSIGILLVVTTIALAIYFCTRTSMPVVSAAGAPALPRDVEQGGIDEATLEAFPAVSYAEARMRRKGKAPAAAAQEEAFCCCPVCLDGYGDGDVVRVLPDCGHLFHRDCVDPWLRKRPTCPVCRTSPLPSPMPTPLAEVTPLASARARPS
ncbi:hypothetical protein BDA96_02G038800 [Sorghum bicolor]|uniref:RING-type domain-containing protein n=2 Tax=Sorghum bicolor TaxID=4558 RepID=A0A1W0W264_SORBI|nr:RING-H2 finger protein ATL70 [Sorghum bicolor]KAG0541690.1 hypothetical protein BDA96_02G038800 [Sorghum bicolor]OQU88460.1 hypothetical protein SORBI_3002G038733 [Sorghum bicolor]|eukprot:XP_002459363.1 RING-H2 finger protein ATL70 [Sorghum bicolor]